MTYLFAYAAIIVFSVLCALAAATVFGVSLTAEVKEWWVRHHSHNGHNLLPH